MNGKSNSIILKNEVKIKPDNLIKMKKVNLKSYNGRDMSENNKENTQHYYSTHHASYLFRNSSSVNKGGKVFKRDLIIRELLEKKNFPPVDSKSKTNSEQNSNKKFAFKKVIDEESPATNVYFELIPDKNREENVFSNSMISLFNDYYKNIIIKIGDTNRYPERSLKFDYNKPRILPLTCTVKKLQTPVDEFNIMKKLKINNTDARYKKLLLNQNKNNVPNIVPFLQRHRKNNSVGVGTNDFNDNNINKSDMKQDVNRTDLLDFPTYFNKLEKLGYNSPKQNIYEKGKFKIRNEFLKKTLGRSSSRLVSKFMEQKSNATNATEYTKFRVSGPTSPIRSEFDKTSSFINSKLYRKLN